MVQIQFLDKNVVGALLPAYSLKPERVVFLYDSKIVNKYALKEIQEAIKRRLPKTLLEFVHVNMLCMNEIKSALEEIVSALQTAEGVQKKEIHVDITGGSELMTACGFMIAKQYALTLTYVDFQKGYVYDVFTMESLAKTESVCLEDYLTALGGKVLSVSKYIPKENDFHRILSMAKIIFQNEKKWDKFFLYMTKSGYSARGVMEFSVRENEMDRDCQFILSAFLDRGFAKMIGKNRYRFSSEADKEYMIVSGIWLEMYMYIQAKQCFDEVYMGVDIDWNKRDICHSRDNEIDVVVMKDSQPIFISCKMRPVDKHTVYEIYAMAKRLGGTYAKSLIATTTDVRKGKEESNSIYMRMEKMKVGLIEVKDFANKDVSTVFKHALSMTE